MTTQAYPNGTGATQSDPIALARPLVMSGRVWYVYSVTGVDASGNAGLSREAPLKTLAQAVANAANYDIIMLLSGHAETLTAPVWIGQALTVIGEGVIAGKPGASLTVNASAASAIIASVVGIDLRNIYFPANLVDNSAARVQLNNGNLGIYGCWFDCGAHDLNAAVTVLAFSSPLTFESCTFQSVATSVSARPLGGILSLGAQPNGVKIYDSVFRGGPFGFSGAAVDFSAGNLSGAKFRNVSLLNGARIVMGEDAVGYIAGVTSSGDAGVVWS